MAPVVYVSNLEGDEVTSPQLAIDAQIEESKFAHPALHLEPHAKCPDFLELERRLLPNDLALVPRLPMSSISCRSHDGLPSS